MLVFILTLVSAQFTQKLHFHYPNNEETIAEFTITNRHEIDFSNTLQPMSLFPRSFLENLHVHGKAKNVYISTT